MKLLKRLIVAIAVLFPLSHTAEARRGCCSHHGGVCSNQCCDGTQLSAKCGGGSYILPKDVEKLETNKPKQKPKNQATTKAGMLKAG